MSGRRDFLIAMAGGAAVVAGGARLLAPGAPDLVFDPMTRPEGFRMLRSAGGGGAGAALFAGLDAPSGPPEGLPAPENFCAALFPGAAYGPPPSEALPAAVFTDFRCPYCRVLDGRLMALGEAGPQRIALHVHHWPTLGPASDTLARVALAARLQGAGEAMERRLWQAGRFAPTESFIRAQAEALSLSAEALLRDMQAPETEAHLMRAAAMAWRFGFVGTPGLALGRSVIGGAAEMPLLRRVIDAEKTRFFGCA